MANLTLRELKDRLTREQLHAAELIVANDYAGKGKRTLEAIAEELGVNPRTLYTWRQNPDFIKYCAWISETKLDSFRAVADAQLLRLIEGTSNNGIPSIKALELFYKLNGRLVERREVVQTDDRVPKNQMTNEDIARDIAELDELLND